MANIKKTNTANQARDMWETDPRVVRWLENYLGFQFDLDACCTPYNKRAPLGCIIDPRFRHDKESLLRLGLYWDGLATPWHKIANNTFCNMPFSTKGKWIAKNEHESRLGTTSVMVAPVAMTTGWWREMEQAAERILQPDKRLNFINPTSGMLITGVSFETSFAIFRPKREVLIERVKVVL